MPRTRPGLTGSPPIAPYCASILTTVYQCGGRGGIHRSWENFSTRLKYVSFEPESEGFNELLDASTNQQDGRIIWAVEPTAVAEKTCVRDLNIYNHGDLSSFFELDKELTHRYRDLDVRLVQRTEVPCKALDEISAARGDVPDFLCLDVQGAELMILTGAEEVLQSSVLGVRCEVAFMPLYKKQPLFDDIYASMAGHGFKLARLERCGSGSSGISTDAGAFSANVDDAAPAWADAIFFREPDAVGRGKAGPGAARAEAMAKLFFFLIANASGSLALDLLLRLREREQLGAIFQYLESEARELIRETGLRYLEKAEQSVWQTDPQYLLLYPEKRRSLRTALRDIAV